MTATNSNREITEYKSEMTSGNIHVNLDTYGKATFNVKQRMCQQLICIVAANGVRQAKHSRVDGGGRRWKSQSDVKVVW